MVLGAIQVISVFAALAGLWNLYAGWTRIRFATPIEQRLHTVPDAVRPLTGYVFIAVVNLLLGGFVGLLLVGIDVIHGKLTEINVTAPTGVRAIKKLGGPDLAAQLFDVIEAKR